jgi:LPXTG-motif cell wall-anchored protein
MRIALNIIGLLLILTGGVWFLQGINLLPGSFMTGQTQWAVIGGISLLLGIVLLVFANRRR